MENATLADSGGAQPVLYLQDIIYRAITTSLTVLSSLSASIIIGSSFYLNGVRSFFSWNKGARFIFYLALYDLFYHGPSIVNHSFFVINRVQAPKTVCIVLASFILQFSCAQALLLNAVAVHAYLVMKKRREVSLGRWDCYLHMYCIVPPLICIVIAICFDQLGPNGVVCVIHRVRGFPTLMVRISFFIVVFVCNIILFVNIWKNIGAQINVLGATISKRKSASAFNKVIISMVIWLTTYLLQWFGLIMAGLWSIFGSPPDPVMLMYSVGCHFGGILDLIVYVYLHMHGWRNKALQGERTKNYKSDSKDLRGPVCSRTTNTDADKKEINVKC